MIVFTKFSNERDPRFRIRTDIVQEEERRIRKMASAPESAQHIADIYERYLLLEKDLAGSGIQINPCTYTGDSVWFPYRAGRTLEQRLDELLAKGLFDELEKEIAEYFSLFSSDGCSLLFSESREFTDIFGHADLPQPQYCRAVSDIDLVFSNAIETGNGYELIDYEWTFAFPVPIKYIEYRCLYYYMYGNVKRKILIERNLFERFSISPREQEQFAGMEKRFQKYILGDYTPIWKLYPLISEGVIEVEPLVEKESRQKKQRTVEVYFDDGRGFGSWNMQSYRVEKEESVTLSFLPPSGTRNIRVDPCTGSCVLRVNAVEQDGRELSWTSNGLPADNGDIVFETEDPQLLFQPADSGRITITFFAEPLGGLARAILVYQHSRISQMEQTKAWRAYRKARKLLKKD
ncbi:MAG: hypothetical protein LUH07_11835 [Lachnospiraceae bacterium]|nr:hypothetical protein [Lachnospiraceae bacterium]